MKITSMYADKWRKINNVPDSDVNEAPAELEVKASEIHGHHPLRDIFFAPIIKTTKTNACYNEPTWGARAFPDIA